MKCDEVNSIMVWYICRVFTNKYTKPYRSLPFGKKEQRQVNKHYFHTRNAYIHCIHNTCSRHHWMEWHSFCPYISSALVHIMWCQINKVYSFSSHVTQTHGKGSKQVLSKSSCRNSQRLDCVHLGLVWSNTRHLLDCIYITDEGQTHISQL